MIDLEYIEQCPKCKSISVNVDVCTGKYICSRCGFSDKKEKFKDLSINDLQSLAKDETKKDFKKNFK